jgi:hypothetical protein
MREIKNTLDADGLNQSSGAPMESGTGKIPSEYIPQKPLDAAKAASDIGAGVATQDDKDRRAIQAATMGRARDVGDPLLAMEGIVNGDPVGMETFDLGFYDDGTPAININGAAIPVDQSMWMALLQARVATRDEMDRRMQHQIKVNRTKELVSKVLRANPNISSDMADGLVGLTDQYPDFVAEQTYRISVNMAYDGGKTQANELQAMKMDTLGQATANRLLSKRARPIDMNNPQERQFAITSGKAEIPMGSIRDEAIAKAMGNGKSSHAAALGTMEFFSGGGDKRRSRASRGLPTTGLFDITMESDGNSGENPTLWWAMQIASDRTMWGDQALEIPTNVSKPEDIQQYMGRLQSFFSMHFGYGPSDERSTLSAFQWIGQKLQAGNVALQQRMTPPSVEERGGGSTPASRNPQIVPSNPTVPVGVQTAPAPKQPAATRSGIPID